MPSVKGSVRKGKVAVGSESWEDGHIHKYIKVHPRFHISLLTKVCVVKSMFFSVVMYGCESWTKKKAEC